MDTTTSQSGNSAQHPSKRVWARAASKRGHVAFTRGARSPQILTKGMKLWIGAAGAYYGLLALGTHLVLH